MGLWERAWDYATGRAKIAWHRTRDRWKGLPERVGGLEGGQRAVMDHLDSYIEQRLQKVEIETGLRGISGGILAEQGIFELSNTARLAAIERRLEVLEGGPPKGMAAIFGPPREDGWATKLIEAKSESSK